MNRLWDVTSYICELSHMNKVHRISLERIWKTYIQGLCFRGIYDSFSWINAGKHVVKHTTMETVITKFVLLDVSLYKW